MKQQLQFITLKTTDCTVQMAVQITRVIGETESEKTLRPNQICLHVSLLMCSRVCHRLKKLKISKKIWKIQNYQKNWRYKSRPWCSNCATGLIGKCSLIPRILLSQTVSRCWLTIPINWSVHLFLFWYILWFRHRELRENKIKCMRHHANVSCKSVFKLLITKHSYFNTSVCTSTYSLPCYPFTEIEKFQIFLMFFR